MMVMIQTMTPSKVPYLQGATYEFIPGQLIPRVLSPKKAWAHTGNMILSMHYGLLTEETIFNTSIGFDPVMEAYANYGYIGVLALAVIMGFFLGWVTKLTINVPMLSFGFMFGVLVIGSLIGSFNTTGVYVTTTWQSFLALVGLSFVLMGKLENPVWKYYALKLAQKLKLKGRDPKTEAILKEVEAVAGSVSSEDGERPSLAPNLASGGATKGGRPPSSNSDLPSANEAAPVRNERPKRFVYGEKK
jgi:hypothetical protein